MTIVSPSLLSSDFMNLEKEINILNKIKNIWLHLDIMDGHFVPNLTFGHEIIKQICSVSKNPTDAHLMVSNPDFYIDTLKDFNLHNITYHFEVSCDHLSTVKKAKQHFPSVGISIKPFTPVAALPYELLSCVDLVLVMSVEPGFGGQKFMPESINKIAELNKLKEENNYTYQIQVDGGVSSHNAKDLINAGANNLVAGSFVFRVENNEYNKKIKLLR